MIHKKNKLATLNAILMMISKPIPSHILVSKLSSAMLEVDASETSFCIQEEKPYLMGDMYSTQPIQRGKLAEFLKKPENKTNGRRRMGVTSATAF